MPLIGCGEHKFNLAVRHWIKDQQRLRPIIDKGHLAGEKHILNYARNRTVPELFEELLVLKANIVWRDITLFVTQ